MNRRLSALVLGGLFFLPLNASESPAAAYTWQLPALRWYEAPQNLGPAELSVSEVGAGPEWLPVSMPSWIWRVTGLLEGLPETRYRLGGPGRWLIPVQE